MRVPETGEKKKVKGKDRCRSGKYRINASIPPPSNVQFLVIAEKDGSNCIFGHVCVCVCALEKKAKRSKQRTTTTKKKRWFQKFTIKRTHGRFCNASTQEGAFSANLQPSFPANAPLKEEDQKKVLTHNNLSRSQNALIRARARNTSRHSGEGLRLGDELHP